jgi:2-polyprenyl-3-methyl-5-hydroxy-6-metoxy-1,4-benzoquinol methylase
MKTDYDNQYYPNNVYGHVVELVSDRVKYLKDSPGVHLDLGCGYGRMAEPLAHSTGLTYIGLDLDTPSIESLVSRGMEAYTCDLRLPADALKNDIKSRLAGRVVTSISLIDVLEHIAEPATLLQVVRELLIESNAFFVVSVPNIAHRDVGFKLALGRYDIRATGILDYTHFHGFTETGLHKFLAQHGLHIIERKDVVLELSDQAFPQNHPALSGTALLGSYLREMRDSVDRAATINQLVATCLAGPVEKPAHLITEEAIEKKAPFLSIITRTQGRRPATLRDVLLSLAAQTCDDFELIVVGHKLDSTSRLLVERLIDDTPQYLRDRIRLMLVDRGNRTAPLNDGFEVATGRYVAILDDDDLPMAHWVETFKNLAKDAPGCVLRAVAVKQECDEVTTSFALAAAPRAIGGFAKEYPSSFNWLEHLRVNQTPPIALAFPRTAFADLNIRFDEALTTTEDWDFLMRTVAVCGAASSPAITCIYRWWKGAESSRSVHSQEEWRSNHNRIFEKIDGSATLIPAGVTRQIRALMDHNDRLSHVVSELSSRLSTQYLPKDIAELLPEDAGPRAELQALLRSRSWRASAPLREIKRLLRGLPRNRIDVAMMSPTQVTEAVRNIRASSSWRLAQSVSRIVRR